MAISTKKVLGGDLGKKAEDVKNESILNTSAAAGDTATDATNTIKGATMGFGFNNFLIKKEKGSEYVEKFSKKLVELLPEKIEDNNISISINVFNLDKNKEAFSFLDYSYTVLAVKSNKSNKVVYFPYLLEATGEKPKTTNEIVENLRRNPKYFVPLSINAFNDILKKTIEAQLKVFYKINDEDLESAAGLVIPYYIEPEEAAERTFDIGANAAILRLGRELGIIPNISLTEINTRDTRFKLYVNNIDGVSKNSVGRVIRSEFRLDLKQEPIVTADIYEPNSNYKVRDITSNIGYIDFVIHEEVDNFGKLRRKIVPVVVLSYHVNNAPSIEYTLLNIINASIFTDPNYLGELLLEINNKKNLGVLNYFTNIEDDKSGFGKKIKLSTQKYSLDEIVNVINEMFILKPVFVIEVEEYGENVEDIPFIALNRPTKHEVANEYIKNVASVLVGTKITARVALNEGFTLPVGRWIDANGNERDVKELDLVFVTENGNTEQIFKYTRSMLPKSMSGIDSFTNFVELCNELLPNPIIESRVTRIPLNPEFIAQLVTAAKENGYNPNLSAANELFKITNNDLKLLSKAYSEAFTNNLGFGFVGNTGTSYNIYQNSIFGL